jgi:hypothetical protein
VRARAVSMRAAAASMCASAASTRVTFNERRSYCTIMTECSVTMSQVTGVFNCMKRGGNRPENAESRPERQFPTR